MAQNNIAANFPSMNDSRFSFVQKFRQERLANIRPLTDFFDKNRFSKPNDMSEVTKRWNFNLQYYQGNYVLILLSLIIWVLFTNIFLLFTIIFILGSFIFISSRGEGPIMIGTSVWTTKQLYASLFFISIPLLWLSSAGSAIFWLIGAGAVIILGHAAFIAPDVAGDFATGQVQV